MIWISHKIGRSEWGLKNGNSCLNMVLPIQECQSSQKMLEGTALMHMKHMFFIKNTTKFFSHKKMFHCFSAFSWLHVTWKQNTRSKYFSVYFGEFTSKINEIILRLLKQVDLKKIQDLAVILTRSENMCSLGFNFWLKNGFIF